MRQAIDGITYDTQAAEWIHGRTNGRPVHDPKHRRKDLYLDPEGRWFLLHTGGRETDCSRTAYIGKRFRTVGAQRIEPVDLYTVRRFLAADEKHDLIRHYFGDDKQSA